MRLQGRAVLITGGGTGIGRAIALRFAGEGAGVVINYSKSQAQAEEVARLAREKNVKAVAIKADVSQDADARRLVAESLQALGQVDTLVNCAGWTRRILHHDLEALDDGIWDRTWAVNVKGAFFCARAVIPEMQRIGGGTIINVTSVAGFTGQGSSIPYCASKAAMTAVTKSLARAFAPTIRVNAIAPGLVDTGFADWPDVIAWGKTAYPLRRVVEPEEVADAALFLAADAQALTGQTIFVDCGVTALGPVSQDTCDRRVDQEGRPTDDPRAAMAGAVLPFGGAKAYGLCFAIHLLGILAGGDPVPAEARNWGHLFMAIDPARFMPVDSFTTKAAQLVAAVKSSRRAEGFEEILIPGERSSRERRRRREAGFEVSDEVARALAAL